MLRRWGPPSNGYVGLMTPANEVQAEHIAPPLQSAFSLIHKYDAAGSKQLT